MIDEAIKVGKLLLEVELIDGASGNMSFRDEKNNVVITRTGAELFNLKPEDFVKIDDLNASRDRKVHKAIYDKTNFKCVLHCHGTFNVVLSIFMREINPIDLEGKMYFGSLKVVDEEFGTEKYAEKISELVAENSIAIAKAHGIYVAAKDFMQAFNLASYAEHSCKVLYLCKLLESTGFQRTLNKF
ncbi:MAG: class II aldolase/adducin family protein [Archaeoglobaceae archaeon]|nr:class II aldolase/adducin family protein [Archaeoglobaceae archaeon]MCX8151689.1 class II aldolase/adducin family protein [Archaeoglobaceae archaeon]MDW8013033.1 class II aldolase/adducin family protein [Archaeoglobaceae archaeon]